MLIFYYTQKISFFRFSWWFPNTKQVVKQWLASIPLYIFLVVQPNKGTFKQIDSLMANIFWDEADGKKKYHWIAWDDLCMLTQPNSEGGIGIRKFQSFCDSSSAKNWWNFWIKKWYYYWWQDQQVSNDRPIQMQLLQKRTWRKCTTPIYRGKYSSALVFFW